MRGTLEAGQTRDHQPRSRLPQNKTRRDRLIRRATEPPTWVLGCADDVWWSRWAPPAQHRWGEAEAVTRLQELTRAQGDPAPNALAWAGWVVRRLPPQAEQMWLRLHNQPVNTRQRGVRIVAYWLPVTSPWLNPIAPKWVHGTRAVLEPDRLLSAVELETRLCTYDACTPEAHVLMPQKVA